MPCARGCCAPTDGTVLASPVNVLLRSVGRSKPVLGSDETRLVGCSSQTGRRSAWHTLPMALEQWEYFFASSSHFPPLPLSYHLLSSVNKVAVVLAEISRSCLADSYE